MLKVTEHGLFFVGKVRDARKILAQLRSYPDNLTLRDFCAVAIRDASALEFLRVR